MGNNKEREKFYRNMNSIMRFYYYVGLGVILFIAFVFFYCLVTGNL